MFLRVWLALTASAIAVTLSGAQAIDLCSIINAYKSTVPQTDSLSGSAITRWSWVSDQCASGTKSYDSQWKPASSQEKLNLVFSESNQSPFTGLELRKTFDVALSADGSTLSSAQIAIQFRGGVQIKDGSKTTTVQVCA